MKICIAGIKINLTGEIYDYFKYRIRDYIISESSECDINITYRENNAIKVPECEIVQKKDFRVFAVNNDKCYYYDILRENEYSALIVSDNEWTDIKCELMDVEDMGGASLNIRQFNMIGLVIRYIMINHSGMSLHSSSIAYKDHGIMFSADSGTGKSTHTRLWKKVFDNVEIINDDMPVIRKIDGVWYLFGCPWSGKTEININKKVPLKSIVFIERGKTNEIEPIYSPECVFKIIRQTLMPAYKQYTKKAMDNIAMLVNDIPVYRLKCTISEEAPKVVANELDLM